jgi:hypothetical protein
MKSPSSKAGKTASATATIKGKVPENPQYGCRMFFNAYEIEDYGTGRLVRFAFVRQNACDEVVQLYLPMEVLRNVRFQNETYLQTLPHTPFPSKPSIPTNSPRSFAPRFVNHIIFAYSHDHGEIGFHVVPMYDIAKVVKKSGMKKAAKKDVIPMLPVALLHAELPLYVLFCLELMENVKK